MGERRAGEEGMAGERCAVCAGEVWMAGGTAMGSGCMGLADNIWMLMDV